MAKDFVEFPLGFIDALTQAASYREIVSVAAEWVPGILGADRGSLTMLGREGLFVRAFQGETLHDPNDPIPITGTPVELVMRTGRPKLLTDLLGWDTPIHRSLHAAGYRSVLLLPLQCGDQFLGSLNVSSYRTDAFGDRQIRTGGAVAGWLASQLLIRRQADEMKRLSETDALTGILNRRAFTDRAADMLRKLNRESEPFALVLFDVDRFKQFNDRFGHSGGDSMLIGVAQAVADSVRETDAFARIGGEEFAVLLGDTTLQEAHLFAERFRKLIETTVTHHEGRQVTCTCSFGVSAAVPGETDIDGVLKRADDALYRAKAQGRNRVEYAA